MGVSTVKLRALAVLFFCLGLFYLSQQPRAYWQSRDSSFNVSVSTGCTAATNFLARTSGLSGTETTAYTTMICGLVTDSIITGNLSGATGCGAVLDGLYIFATKDTATANLNLCGTSFGLTQSGSVTFHADSDYQGDGSTGYLDTGLTPSTFGGNFSLNSASEALYDLTNRTTTDVSCAIGALGGVGGVSQLCLNFTGGTLVWSLNAAASGTPTITTAQGFTTISRTASNLTSSYRNGVAVTSGTSAAASTSLSTDAFSILARNNANVRSNFSVDKFSAAVIGGALTSGQQANLSTRINGYMTALGINVY